LEGFYSLFFWDIYKRLDIGESFKQRKINTLADGEQRNMCWPIIKEINVVI